MEVTRCLLCSIPIEDAYRQTIAIGEMNHCSEHKEAVRAMRFFRFTEAEARAAGEKRVAQLKSREEIQAQGLDVYHSIQLDHQGYTKVDAQRHPTIAGRFLYDIQIKEAYLSAFD